MFSSSELGFSKGLLVEKKKIKFFLGIFKVFWDFSRFFGIFLVFFGGFSRFSKTLKGKP